MKKILQLDQFRFLLPDNFNGSMADAFRLAADYLDIPKDPIPQPNPIDPIRNVQEASDMAWKQFVETVTLGRKVSGVVALFEWNSKKHKWNSLPLKTGGGI